MKQGFVLESTVEETFVAEDCVIAFAEDCFIMKGSECYCAIREDSVLPVNDPHEDKKIPIDIL